MTTLVAWIGVDSRGPTSVHLGADSRLSWSDGSKWDQGRKLFAAQTKPEILGYCGDVLFPSQVLGQTIAAIDAGLFDGSVDADDKATAMRHLLADGLAGYPTKHRQNFSILYCTRTGIGMKSVFSCFEFRLESGRLSQKHRYVVPEQSGAIAIRGSGQPMAEASIRMWQDSGQSGTRTSRAVFGGLCDAIRSSSDPQTGGAPQLVALFRKGPARTLGVTWEGKGFIHGLHVQGEALNSIEWRNDRFERVDSNGQLLSTAQRQPRPNNL